jgi:site-specific DNA-methyltransferase (adenine-specific)
MKKEKIAALDKAGDMYWTSSGIPRRKVRPGVAPGAVIDNLWFDIEAIGSQAAERLGYPTQKPLSLLERIIKVSSDKGDVVLDPFCGCGTTVEAAEILGREWVGIDVTHYAVTLIEKRLQSHAGADFKVVGRPTDLAGAQDLARRDKYQFQWWASWRLGAQTYETKKGADRGIDGNIYFFNGPYGHGRIIVSVKGGDQLSPVMVRELAGTVEREGAEMGILVTLGEPTKAMLTEASGHGFVSKSAHGRLPRIQIATAQDLLDGHPPKMPPIPKPADQRPRGKSAKDRDQLELLFAFEGDGIRTGAGGFVDPAWLMPSKRSK